MDVRRAATVALQLLARELADPRPGQWPAVARLAWQTFRRAPALALPPLHLQVEPTSRCNLRCPMCEHGSFGGRGADLPPARLAGLLAEVPALRSVDLTGIGEPLLHRGFAELLHLTGARRLRVRFNTNATLLAGAARALVLAGGVDEVHVSLDGATAATFDAQRPGAGFGRVTANVRALTAARRRGGPRVSLQLVLTPASLAEAPALVDLAADLGADAVSCQGLLGVPAAQNPLLAAPDAVRATLAAARARARRRGLTFTAPALRAPRGCCPLPWTQAFVQVDGVVLPCCLYSQRRERDGIARRHGMGRIGEQPFAAIWNGTGYRRLRTELAAGRRPGPCASCPLPAGLY
ncbi:MAG TPA: radical SAM protein [Polyangia bacterium]|jgi:MoaA/NifB/PqqE/SkfB family radical SAM enzyme